MTPDLHHPLLRWFMVPHSVFSLSQQWTIHPISSLTGVFLISLWLENTHQGSSGRFQKGQSIVRDDISSHAVLVDIWDKIPYVCVLSTSCVQRVVTPWTIAHQAPLSMGFSRQEYWNGCHALLQGIFLTQVSNPHLLRLLNCRQILYHWATTEAQKSFRDGVLFKLNIKFT